MPKCFEAHLRHALYYESLLRMIDDLLLEGGNVLQGGLSLFDLEWDNIQGGQAWAAMHIGELDDATLESKSDAETIWPRHTIT